MANKPDGPFKVYYDNGQLRSTATYKDGNLHGPYAIYHEGGELLKKGTYKHGELDGPYEEYRATGTGALVALVVLTGVIWVTQPWAPLPGSATVVAAGALILWLLPPWAVWIDRHRVSGSGDA